MPPVLTKVKTGGWTGADQAGWAHTLRSAEQPSTVLVAEAGAAHKTPARGSTQDRGRWTGRQVVGHLLRFLGVAPGQYICSGRLAACIETLRGVA